MQAHAAQDRAHFPKWIEAFRSGAKLARIKAVLHTKADGSLDEEGEAWQRVAVFLDARADRYSSGSRRGIASLAPDRQAELAALGGRLAHERGTAHEFAGEEARKAGAAGGTVISKDRSHMATIGQRGGMQRAANLRAHGKPDASR